MATKATIRYKGSYKSIFVKVEVEIECVVVVVKVDGQFVMPKKLKALGWFSRGADLSTATYFFNITHEAE